MTNIITEKQIEARLNMLQNITNLDLTVSHDARGYTLYIVQLSPVDKYTTDLTPLLSSGVSADFSPMGSQRSMINADNFGCHYFPSLLYPHISRDLHYFRSSYR